MKNTFLTKEIIRHILTIMGSGKSSWGTGISDKSFNTSKKIKLQEDNSEVISEYPIFGCEYSDDFGNLKILSCNLSQNDDFESLVVLQVNDMPAYVLKLIFDDNDLGVFNYYLSEKFYPVDLVTQCQILISLEKLFSLGVNWKKIENYQNLFDILKLNF
jgi:hypothetical protein